MFHNQQLARGRRGHVEFLLHGTMGSELVRERRWVISGFYSTVLKIPRCDIDGVGEGKWP